MPDVVVTCVTCEQVLSGGRCTNEMCPGYVPLAGAEPGSAPTAADLERALTNLISMACPREVREELTALIRRWGAAKALEEVRKVGALRIDHARRMAAHEPVQCEDYCARCAIEALCERLAREVEGA